MVKITIPLYSKYHYASNNLIITEVIMNFINFVQIFYSEEKEDNNTAIMQNLSSPIAKSIYRYVTSQVYPFL